MSNEDDWTTEDTMALLKTLKWFGWSYVPKSIVKATVITTLAVTTGTLGLSALARLKEADYPLE